MATSASRPARTAPSACGAGRSNGGLSPSASCKWEYGSMVKLLRLAVMTCGVVAVPLVAALLHPEWASDLGIKPWSLSRPPSAPASQCSSILPGPQTLAVNRRIEEKQHAIDLLLAGQRTFFETAALFRRLNDDYPKLPLYPDIHGDSYEERICRQVIIWVRGTLYMRGYP